MKASEAPKKIYLSKDLFRLSFGKASDKSDIEYTRTDAFVEKACEYLSKHQCEYIDFDDFRKAMKGE